MDDAKPQRKPIKDFGGDWVTIGDEQFKVAPISFKNLREITPKLAQLRKISGLPSAEDVDVMVDIIAGAVERNYPGLDRDEFANKLDMTNLQGVLRSIMAASGLRPVEPGETKPV